MLSEILQGEKTEYAAPCVMLLGGFDGLHIGHKKLVECAKEYGLPVGTTTITGGKGEVLFTLVERQKIFAKQGIDFVCPFAFTETFKNTTKEEFLTFLTSRFNARVFVCGKDFRFGKGAEGTPEFIEKFTHIPVRALDVLNADGKKVSASSVKGLLKNGETEKANELLCEPFFMTSRVEEGRKTGRTIGFPTANFRYPQGKLSPKEGVYSVSAQIDGKIFGGIANLGACPTFGVAEKKPEVYFDGFHGDLYGREMDVSFKKYLRPIRKFDGKEALKAQLEKDLRRI